MLLVPFDGSALAKTALSRAREFGSALGEDVLVLVVVPDDASFARERGWITADEPFDPQRAGDELAMTAGEIAPESEVHVETTEATSSLASTETDISRTIREVAHERDATVVFVGSENAGRVTAPPTSVGTPVAEDPDYDVYIARHAE
ncbi:universal stress protein [Halococcus thailandensis]|uniref:Universal stress protein n=1 Tax=Halococcus thailandensis JCM 13552 TaxID=1227457 RepID=M0NAP0_9EURY|nr:universal stress protein [Halococcus thailandensis]EMA54164.1 universal stress protein [Halococcus thailandensis JCM 13552]